MLSSIPWQMILWAIAALVSLYYLGWEIFGPPKRAHQLLVNTVTGLAFAWSASLVAGLFGAALQLNLATLAASIALGIPGAALVSVLQWVL